MGRAAWDDVCPKGLHGLSSGPTHSLGGTRQRRSDYDHAPADITPQHYAFLVSEAEFDEVLARVKARGLPIYAEPTGEGAGELNRNWGGRGFYFPDPNGHWMEVLTRPYGYQG
ncbi:VOC family protein [Archangium sp.]|uniref:VOC family protein n=1 Tax=Archangium sp. TaxID=1872627 RepID=UPI00389A0694